MIACRMHRRGGCGSCNEPCVVCCPCEKKRRGRPSRRSESQLSSVPTRHSLHRNVLPPSPQYIEPPEADVDQSLLQPEDFRVPTVSTVADLARVLGLSATIGKNLPKTRRKLLLGEAATNDVQRCDAVFRLLITEVARLVYPADHAVYARRFYLSAQIETLPVINGYQHAARGSIERRSFKALACASLSRQDASAALGRIDVGSVENGADDDTSDEVIECERDVGDIYARMQDYAAVESQPVDSEGAARSPVGDAPDEATFVMSKESFANAKRDWAALMNDGILRKRMRTVRKVSDETLRGVIEFLFDRANAQIRSWGVKVVRVKDEKCEVPVVTRKKSRATLWKEFVSAEVSGGFHKPRVSRSTFYIICNASTSRDSHNKAVIDYVQGILVGESEQSLRRVVCSFVEEEPERQDMLLRLEKIIVFLKHGFAEKHVNSPEGGLDNGNGGLHDNKFALNDSSCKDLPPRSISCKECAMPFDFVEHLKSYVPQDRTDVLEVLEDISDRFLIFLGHRHRVKAQQYRMSSVLHQILQRRACDEVVVHLDYKMKFEAVRFRETMLQWYGKKGLSWHGAAVHFLPQSFTSESSISPDALACLFYHHIVKNETTQDWVAVANICGAIFSRLKIDLPHVKKVTLVSDNASYYQCGPLPVVLPFVAHVAGLRLGSYMQFETCDGKSVIDASFVIGMKRVMTYVREGNDVATPRALVGAISSKEGIANTVAELVTVSRDQRRMKDWVNMAKREKKNLARLGRVNEFVHDAVQNDEDPEKSTVGVQVYSFSGVNPPRAFTFSRAKVTEVKPSSSNVTMEIEGNGDYDGADCENEDDYSEDSGDEDGERASHLQNPNNTARARICPETGSVVATSAEMRRCEIRLMRQQKRRKKERETMDETDIGMIQNPSPDGGRRKDPGNCQGEGLEEDEDFSADDPDEYEKPFSICPKCSREYTSVKWYARHAEVCQGDQESTNLRLRAAKMANEIISMPTSNIVLSGTALESVPLLNPTYSVPAVKRGWACRPKRGHRYGKSFINDYKAELQVLFGQGRANKGSKANAAMMLDKLIEAHPGRYNLPSEETIKKFISAAYAKQKDQEKRQRRATRETNAAGDFGESEGANTMPTRKNGLNIVYSTALEEVAGYSSWQMKPASLVKELKRKFMTEGNLPPDFPSDAKIKNRYTSQKAKRAKHD